MSSNIQKKSTTELSKDFRSVVTKLESDLMSIADGTNIIAGTSKNPIVNNIKKYLLDIFLWMAFMLEK